MISTILFDLDGTLLPLDQDTFLKAYFTRLTRTAANQAVDGQTLMKVLMRGVEVMQNNDGRETNETLFSRLFAKELGTAGEACLPAFDKFYAEEFDAISAVCEKDDRLPALIKQLKAAGFRLVLATSPMFPAVAVEKRMGWAGLDPADFDLITTYENCTHSKPNPAYYADILGTVGCPAEEAVMIGNDVDEDMVAATLGMRVFLLTDHLVNRAHKDLSPYPHGSVEDLIAFLREINCSD